MEDLDLLPFEERMEKLMSENVYETCEELRDHCEKIEKTINNKFDIIQNHYRAIYGFMTKANEKNNEKLKALKIIKAKRVNVHVLTSSFCENVEQYNNNLTYDLHLTQREYDLLIRVLRNNYDDDYDDDDDDDDNEYDD